MWGKADEYPFLFYFCSQLVNILKDDGDCPYENHGECNEPTLCPSGSERTIVARSRNDLASIPTTESAMTDRKVVPNIVHWARIQTIVSGALWNG